MDDIQEVKPENTPTTGRNPDGTWKPGFCPNPGGRKRNPLKEFSLDEFNKWTDDQKKDFLAKISPYDRWRMTEGNPITTLEGNEENPLVLQVINYGKDNKDTPQLPAEGISVAITDQPGEVQDSGVAQEIGEVKDSPKPADNQKPA